MIYISTAMYFEAESLIKYFCLKKNKKIDYTDIFENDTITLIVSGIGGINSAVLLSRFFSNIKLCENDYYINMGICGCSQTSIKSGTAFIINKIRSSYTGKCLYPDIIYDHSFNESSIETFAEPNTGYKSECILSDMESYEIFISVSSFFRLHRIIFLKIVSDHNNPQNITREFINKITDNKYIYEFIKTLSQNKESDHITDTVSKYTDIFSEMLKLTQTMHNELSKLITYYILCKGDLSLLDNFTVCEITNKTLSKKYYNELKNILLNETF